MSPTPDEHAQDLPDNAGARATTARRLVPASDEPRDTADAPRAGGVEEATHRSNPDVSPSGAPSGPLDTLTEEQGHLIEERLSKAPPKSSEVADLADLFIYAHSRSGQRLATTRTVLDRIRDAERPGPVDRAIVRLLSRGDKVVATVPRMLALVARKEISGLLRRRMLEMCLVSLQAHPALIDTDLSGLLTPHATKGESTPSADLDEVLAQIAKDTTANAKSVLGDDHTPGTARTLRSNAVGAAALLMALRWSLAPSRVVAAMHTALWVPEAADAGEPASVLLTLDFGAASLGQVGLAWHEVVSDATDERAHMDVVVEQAQQRVATAEQALAASHEEIAALRGQIEELQSQLRTQQQAVDRERQERHNQLTHASSDYESLRATVMKTYKAQVRMLEEGLHALRREKTHVTEDRVERSIRQLNKELDGLQGDRP